MWGILHQQRMQGYTETPRSKISSRLKTRKTKELKLGSKAKKREDPEASKPSTQNIN